MQTIRLQMIGPDSLLSEIKEDPNFTAIASDVVWTSGVQVQQHTFDLDTASSIITLLSAPEVLSKLAGIIERGFSRRSGSSIYIKTAKAEIKISHGDATTIADVKHLMKDLL